MAATVFVAVVFAQPASADSVSWSTTGNAVAEWDTSSDHFMVCDTLADGRGARATLWISLDGRTYSVLETVVDSNGAANSCGEFRPTVPQGYWIRYRACDRHNGEPLMQTCGNWAYDKT